MKINERLVYWCAIIILAIAVAATWSVGKKNQKIANANLLAAQAATQAYQNRLGTTTATIQTLQLSNAQMKDAVIGLNSNLKALASEFSSVKNIVIASDYTKIDTVQVTFRDTVPCNFLRRDSVREKWYGFNYKVNQHGLSITNLVIPDTLTVLLGMKRKWLLGKQTITTDITHSNPFASTTYIKSAQVVDPEKWYYKWYVWLAAGLAGGLIIK